jgi:excisionase family DNA binding protein
MGPAMEPCAMSDTTLLTIKDICGSAQISRSFLNKLIKAGQGPPVVKLGRRVLVRETDLAAWIRDRLCHSSPKK